MSILFTTNVTTKNVYKLPNKCMILNITFLYFVALYAKGKKHIFIARH